MTRCPLCPGVNECVAGDGPAQCDYVGVGEAPGGEENRHKRVFHGKTGQEYSDHYLPLAGLSRKPNYNLPQIRTTNAIRCLPVSTGGKLDLNREKDRDLLESCANHFLYKELAYARPKLIIPMGAFASHAIDPDINLDLHHGMPIQTQRGLTFPMYHPAAGLHEPKKMLLIRTDWIRLGKYIKGTLRMPVDEYEGQEDYRHLQGYKAVKEILAGMRSRVMACDTETTRKRAPFCLTFSVEVGTGYLIRADDSEALRAFQEELDLWRGLIVFHNWLFDGAVVAQMGLRFPIRLIRDTMVKVFHFGNLPQGLKALAYRELGMTMEDFDDVVKPHSEPLVLDYYRNAYSEVWEKPEPQMVRAPDGAWKVYRPQSFKTKLKRFFTDYEKALNRGTEKDVFAMWNDNWGDLHAEIEGRCGEWPGKCITHVPFENVIHYAARDSDSTLRLWIRLKKMQPLVRKKPQEDWREVA